MTDTRYFNRTEPTLPVVMTYDREHWWDEKICHVFSFNKMEPIEDEL